MEVHFFTLFSRLAQAENWIKTKDFYLSCILIFLRTPQELSYGFFRTHVSRFTCPATFVKFVNFKSPKLIFPPNFRLRTPGLPGYKLPSSRSRTPSDRFCSPACCASGTRTWLGTSSSDTPRTLATKRISFGSEYNPLACQCQCPQLRCELHGITFGFLDYWYKACESQYLTDALCPLGAV